MIFEDSATDAYCHRKLGGIGDLISANINDLSAKYNNGKRVNVINQKLGYLVRCSDPDAIDSIYSSSPFCYNLVMTIKQIFL